ncbi:TolC family protein [Haliea sp. E1-2-M8]|uniref:TolC family protein n=1 Tax=Haliea sp. E1-2-M8 TaxID=3064706 RepID=UPI002717D717|nr:TolC family protein [Haliea sp. E1-2-M8]MDO8860096.1 TolC family protein [Haliea sp. E1-2-M8]
MKYSDCARRIGLALVLVSLAACVSQPPDHGAEQAQAALLARGLDTSLQQDQFAGELSRQQAVQAAVLNHPSVRAEYARLNIAAADVVRASELLNPRLSLSWLDVSGGSNELTLGLAQSLAAVMLRPARQRIAAADYELATLALADNLQELALATESAWYALVAAEQGLQVQARASDTALWADELGSRFAAAGNMAPLQRAELARSAAEARLELLDAERQRDQARARLEQQLALHHEDWSVPTTLPLPATDAPDPEQLVAQALDAHPALQTLAWERRRLLSVGDNARRESWLDEAEVGVEHERSGEERATGPELAFRLPLWHRNAGTRLALAAELELLEAREASLRGQLPRRLRLQLGELSRLREALEVRERLLLPALAAEVEARQDRVNFMLDGVFNLLGSKQSELRAWRDHVATLAEYWQQQVELADTAGRAATPAGEGLLDVSAVAPPESNSQAPEQQEQHHGRHH